MSDLMVMRTQLRKALEAAEARFREAPNCPEIEYYRALVEAAHKSDILFLCDVHRRVAQDGGFFCY